MARVFEVAAALLAVVAAVFWCLYAFGEMPQMPLSDPAFEVSGLTIMIVGLRVSAAPLRYAQRLAFCSDLLAPCGYATGARVATGGGSKTEGYCLQIHVRNDLIMQPSYL
jgi:hypothetical protein